MDRNAAEIADRAAALFVGKPGLACGRCGSLIQYVNAMGGVSCPVCNPPRIASHCRLRLRVIVVNGKKVWADDREESRIDQWHLSTGIHPATIRKCRELSRLCDIFSDNSEYKIAWPPISR